MKIRKTFIAAVVAIAAFFAFTSTPVSAQGLFPFPDRVSQSPAEQDKRLVNLPGKLSEGVKALREDGYRTEVSSWSEKDRGNGLSDGKLGLNGDAGYPYSDSNLNDCNHIDYYTIDYKRVVKDSKPTLKNVDPDDAEEGLRNLFSPLSKELKPLIESGYQVTRVRVPGAFNSNTELKLVKVTEVGGDKPDSKRYVIESLEIRQSVYDHCTMRRD